MACTKKNKILCVNPQKLEMHFWIYAHGTKTQLNLLIFRTSTVIFIESFLA